MKFLDAVKVSLKAGNGGSGTTVFFQDWMQKRPRPTGGNGGNGGDIILVGASEVNTLVFFQMNSMINAENGQSGNKSNKHGKSAQDIYLKVPLGTLVFDEAQKTLLFDFTFSGQEFVVAKGGIGGFGNAFLTKKYGKVINYSQPGSLGERKKVCLDLRFLAEVALIGLPNGGKTSLLNAITNTNSKVGNYPFTTLVPNLGVLNNADFDHHSLISDLPGIIEQAHQNKGLGNQFLKHAQRSYLLIHVVDLSNPKQNILENFRLINNELFQYNHHFEKIPQIIVGNKSDLCISDLELQDFHYQNFIILDFIQVSALKKINLSILKKTVQKAVRQDVNRETVMEKIIKDNKQNIPIYKYHPEKLLRLRKLNNNAWELSSRLLDNFVVNLKLDNPQDLAKLNQFLDDSKINQLLKLEGLKKGDLICLGKKRFYWEE